MAELLKTQQQVDAIPLVTVAMPVYNGGECIKTAVLSIVMQTFTNWELIIVDDGSTDNALEEIAELNDSRIKILRDGQNKGLAARLNEVIDIARGKYLARMDHDDVSYPERFARQVDALSKDADLDLLAVRAITIDENNKVTGLFPYACSHDEICINPWLGFHFPHPTWMGKIEWFRKYRYTIPAPFFCEDQELLLRSFHDSKFGTLGETLFAYRVREKVNQQKMAKTRLAVLNVQVRFFVGVKLWHFVFLSGAVCFVKMTNDFFTKLGVGIFDRSNSLDDTVLSKWKNIIEGIVPEYPG
jgi:glycosyltransferase involved in cell wall biosynthesis